MSNRGRLTKLANGETAHRNGYAGDQTLGPATTRRAAPPAEPGEAWEAPADLGLADGTPAAPTEPRFKFITSAALAGGDFTPQWLVKGALVRGQPAVVGGPSKGMKTSLLVDLAVSLASGRDFLGRFAVPKPVRVAIVSGESGAFTLKETADRISRAKGLALADLGERLAWSFDLPTFSDVAGMVEFADTLAGLGSELCIIDPLYLALGNVDPRSLFEMGAALRVVCERLLRVGCTPLIAHHTNGQLRPGPPMELGDLAFTGLQQLSRQFLLLNRREVYQSDGRHSLWLRVGGSIGHGGLYALHVEEGVTGDDFGGRRWEVGVSSSGDAQAELIDRRDEARREAERKKLLKDEAAVLDAIDAEVGRGLAGATLRRIRDLAGLGEPKAKAAIDGLLSEGAVAEVEVVKPTGNGAVARGKGYRRAGSGGRW